MPYLRLPDGRYAEFDEGTSYAEAYAKAKEAFPKLYADASKAKEGLIPSVKSGVESLLSSYGTAAAPLFGMPEESVRKQVERAQAKRAEIAKAPDFEDVKKAYEKYGFLGGEKPEERGAVSSLLGMWRGQLGESLPQIGAVATGARVGAGLGSMVAPGVGTLAGGALGALAASYPAFVGQNIERQIAEQEKAGEKKPLDWRTAATAAAPQAALDVAETALVLGRLGMGKLLTNSLPKLGAAKAEEALVKASQRSLAKSVGRGVAVGEVTEIPTELAQQVLERWQAGLSLFDEDAKKEYIETAVGVAGPAGALGGVGGISARSQARDQLQQIQEARAAQQAAQQQAAQQAAQQAQQKQQAFEALPPQTQTDIFGEVGGAYMPLQGLKLPTGITTETPEVSLQEEYRKTKAEADRLGSIVEAAKEQKNIPAYNAALKKLEQLDSAQSQIIKLAKEQNIILDVDSELAKAKAAADRYMNKDKPVPDALANSLQTLQTEKQRQLQQQAGTLDKTFDPTLQEDLFNVPRQQAEDTQKATQFAESMAEAPQVQLPRAQPPVPPMLAGMEAIDEQKRQAAEKQQRDVAEAQRVSRMQELGYETAMQRAEEKLRDPVRLLAIDKAGGKDSAMLRRRVEAINANIDQGGLTTDAVQLLGFKIPFDLKTKRPALEIETGLQYKYNLHDPRQAEQLMPVIQEELTKINTAQQKLANKNLYDKGVLTKSGEQAVVLEAKKRVLQRLVDVAKASPKEPPVTRQPLAARKEADEAKAEREQNLFDFANAIDSLRKGTMEEADIEGLQKEATDLKDRMIGAVVREAKARRSEFNNPALTQSEIDAAIDKLDTQFSDLIAKAPESAIVKGPGEKDTKRPTALQAAFERKGFPIKRGMTMGPSLATEFTKLRRAVSRVVYDLSFPKKEKPVAAPVTPTVAPTPAAPTTVAKPVSEKVTVKQVSDAIGVLKTDARFSIEETKKARAAATAAINKGLAEQKSITAILRDVQAATNNGLTAKGIKGIKDLLASVPSKERVTRKEKMEARKEAPTTEQKVEAELSKVGEVAKPRVITAKAAEKERLTNRVAYLEDRVKTKPESKRLAAQLRSAKNKLNAILKQETAEEGTPLEKIGISPEKLRNTEQVISLLTRKRLEKSAQLARAQALVGKETEGEVRARLTKRINEVKAQIAKLRESPSSKVFMASQEAVAGFAADRRAELMKQAAAMPSGPEKNALIAKAEKTVEETPARTVNDAIEALNAERIRLQKDRVEISRAIRVAKSLPVEIKSIEKALKGLGYDISLREAPAQTAVAQKEAERATGAAEYTERIGRKEGTLKTGVGAEAKEPSKIKTRQKGKFGPTVTPVKKEPKTKFKGRLKNPEDFADDYELAGDDRAAFLDYAQDAKFDKTDFRDASSADSGIDTKAAADVATRITKALPSGINVVYAPTLKDAPPAFLAALYRSGKTTAKGAVLPDGTVVVVGDAHKNTADLEETFAHELIGHYGVDMVLGPERMQALTDRLFKQGEDHVAQVATALGVFPDIETALAAKDALKNKDVQMSIAREMIAHAAEGRRVAPTFAEKVKTFVRDMIAAVRAWFRSAGLSDLAKQDAKEIQKLIREASDSLAAGQRGVYVSPDGKAVFRGGEAQYPTGFSAESRQLTDALIYKEKGVIDNVKANLLGLTGMTQFVDRLAPVWAALKQGVATKKISELEAAQVRYDLSVYDKSMNFTRLVASQGALEFKKKGSGAGAYWMVEPKEADPKKAATLIKMFEALKEAGLEENATGNMFTIWLGAQRVKNEGIGVEKLNFGKDAQGNSIVTEAKLAQVEKEIAAMPKVKDAFEKARGIYNEYNKGLVDFAEQSGAISKEVADSLRAKKDYIPFYRPDPDGNVNLVIGDEVPFTIGNLRDQPYLHELVGGNTAISNIFTSSVQNTHLMTQMALRNIATGGVVDALRKLGMLDTRKYKDKETGKEKEALRVSGALTGTDTIRFKKDGEDIAVRVANTDGTIFEGINPALLVKGLEGVTTTMPAMLKLMGIPTQFLRRAVILSPMYPIRQIIKDSFSVLGTSGANFIPVIDPFKNVYKAMTGTSREAQLLERQGLLGGQILAGPNTKENLSTILRGLVSGKQNIPSMLAWAESKSMEADVGVRLSAYNSFLKQGLNEMEAWIATNEIIDFNRRGVSPSVQWANTLYPFFNAQVQGLSVFVKALSGSMPYNERLKIQEKFKQRAIAMAAMTIAYAMAMEDDEAYANATPEQKLNNWFVRVPFADEPLRIPIPFEFGLLAKAIPEAIYTGLAGKEDFEPVAKALMGQIVNSIPGGSSKLIPQTLLPAVEAITGKDLFTGADVESAKMKTLDPSERYKENTTELAKLLGSAGIPGMSPVKIDQFIKGVGSQTLLAAVSLGDAFFESSEKPKPEKKASQLAVIGGAFQPTDAGGIINRTYELMQEGERAVNTYNKLLEEGEEAKAEAYLNDNMARITVGGAYNEFKASMKQIKDEMDYVRRSDDSPATKREQLDLLRKQQIDVAKEYRELIRQAE